MFSLYFKRSTGEEVPVKLQLETDSEVLFLIEEFVYSINPNFVIHYIRSWGENPVVYDVGSHTEFFLLFEE